MQCFMQCLGGGERGFNRTLIVLRDSHGPSSTPEYAQISFNLNIVNNFGSSLWEDWSVVLTMMFHHLTGGGL